MYKQAKCYKCEGFLAVNDSEDASVCPFCGNPFVVQKAIAFFQETAPEGLGPKVVSCDYDGDFVVARSVLVRYNGYTKTDIRIPEGITAIGDSAFQGMNNIESVQIPKGVVSIGAGAFLGCKSLHTVIIPEGVETIGRDVFNGCISLKTISFPASIRTIEAGAFIGCTSLESVIIPAELEVLPWRIFEDCTGLISVTVPEKVKIIEDLAFAECTALETIEFACMQTKDDPSAGVKRIGMNAFRNCKKLNGIKLPETVEYIGNQAFRGCEGLTRIRIPQSVKAIYPLAFADCTGLEQVTFAGDTKLYKGSNPYKYGNDAATFLNCPKLLNVSYSDLQRHYWAFPAYMKSQEQVFMEKGRCRYCGGELKGIFDKVCTVCRAPKDY